MPKPVKHKATLLVVLDGWGIANVKNRGNAIIPETAPNYFSWLKKYPSGQLEASSKAVGLFSDQEGNSEAGHLNLGAGRVVKQDARYISDAIKDGTFFKNQAFSQALHHVKKYKTAAHVMGLLSNHNSAHSCPEHLYALLDTLVQKKVEKIYLHLFTDGRDSGQHDAPHHLKKLEKHLNGYKRRQIKVATVMGRLYAMDRNKVWRRTQKAYEAMVLGHGCPARSAHEALTRAYNRGESDEFICPTVIKNDGRPVATIKDNDAIFFFNLRSDRARQLTKAFVQPDFRQKNPGAFTRQNFPKNTRFAAMTDFGPDLPGVFTAFPSRDVEDSLVQALCPRRQLYVAESEKFAHITYFLNGGYAQHFCKEKWIKVGSHEVDNFEAKPEMSAKKVADEAIKGIESGRYEFIAVNFANADMLGHTGNFEATKKAVSVLDQQIDRIIKTLLKNKGQALITADHGNAEEMINLETGEISSEHTSNPVPAIIINHPGKLSGRLPKGKLADVAPTILEMMNVAKPKAMTGKSLI